MALVQAALDHPQRAVLAGRAPDAGARAALATLDSRLGGGLVKLGLEIALKAAGPARRGEVVRYFIRHAGPTA